MFMTIFLAIILGIIQALTEFLPISSSAHLILARAVLEFPFADGLLFDVALHVGTLIALVVYFRRDIVMIVSALFRSRRSHYAEGDDDGKRLAWYMLAACVPAGIAGLFLEDWIDVSFRNPAVIVVTLVLGGVLFLAVEKFCRPQHVMEQMTFRDAITIGLAQTLALIPGVSRSGITIATGMMVGLKRYEAARFSFVMVIPLLAGAGLKKAFDVIGEPLGPGEVSAMVVGVVSSAVAGWLVIRFLLGFLQRHGLGVFAWYRFALAAVVAAYLIFSR